MARVAVSLMSLAGAMTCPGSPAHFAHAGMKITTTAHASCDTVKGEINARLAGENGWYDQHNRGTFKKQSYGGSVSASRLTGDGKYTDKMIFDLSGSGNTCKIEACSESQVTSLYDNGATYCELELLFCGAADGCKVAKSDFTHSDEKIEKRAEASIGISNCLKAMETEAIRAEEDAQKAYEDFVKETNSSVEAKSKDIVAKTESKAKAEGDLVQAKQNLEGTNLELEQLSNYNAELHSSCDFVVKNFEIRQTGRDEEVEALRQAKAILSGAKFEELLQD